MNLEQVAEFLKKEFANNSARIVHLDNSEAANYQKSGNQNLGLGNSVSGLTLMTIQ